MSLPRQESLPQLPVQQQQARQQGRRMPDNSPDDRHARYARLVAAGERAPETLERLLAVTRLGISMAVDLLRLSDDPADSPPLLNLGYHRISNRGLDNSDGRPGARTIRYQVQEICTYDATTQFTAAPDTASAVEVALLRLRMAPRASVKSGGILSKCRSTVQVEQVELVCSAVVRLTGHEEDYFIQLPDVALREPLTATCCPTLTGSLGVRCAASGLTASISFLPERRVDGTVTRLQGQGTASVASITGFWDSTVQVNVPEWDAQGVLYDADESEAPICTALKLAKLEPMQTPRIWSAIRDALLSIPSKQSGSTMKADGLGQQLAQNLLGGGDGTESLATAPCIEAERAAGKRLRYELQYILQRENSD